MDDVLLKNKIFKFAEDGLVKHFDMTRVEAHNRVQKSKLEIAINRAPDVVAHYSQEQLVTYVMK